MFLVFSYIKECCYEKGNRNIIQRKGIVKKSLKNQIYVIENAIKSCKTREQTEDMINHITKLMTEIDALDTLLKQY